MIKDRNETTAPEQENESDENLDVEYIKLTDSLVLKRTPLKSLPKGTPKYEKKTKNEVIAPIKKLIEQYEELIDIIPHAKESIEYLNAIIDLIEKCNGLEYANISCRDLDIDDEEEMKHLKELENMLPTLQSKLPLYHSMPIQKLATELQHDIIDNGAFDLIVANKGKPNEITSRVIATYEQVEAITMTGTPYTEFDRQVQDAVSSLWEYGHEDHIITPDMVARAMTNKTNTEYISTHFKEAVTDSLEKMRRIHIVLDASEEVRKRKATLNNEKIDSFKIDDFLLSLKGIEIRAGGKTVKGYLIQSEPLLLTYAKRTRQLATVDAQLLDIKEVDKKGNVTDISIKSSEARIAVNGYLLRRITVMKNDRTKNTHKQSNIILFDTLFEETKIPQDSNAKRIKEYAFQVLDYFKATGYIKGYTKRKNRKSFDAVIINL